MRVCLALCVTPRAYALCWLRGSAAAQGSPALPHLGLHDDEPSLAWVANASKDLHSPVNACTAFKCMPPLCMRCEAALLSLNCSTDAIELQ